MQIRLANRQDEPVIRAIAEGALTGSFASPTVNDLTDIEAHYFYCDGVFLVAEEEGEVVGFAAARRKGDGQKPEGGGTLALKRLAVREGRTGQGIEELLLDTVFFFAGNAEYENVQLDEDDCRAGAVKTMKPGTFQTSKNWGDAIAPT